MSDFHRFVDFEGHDVDPVAYYEQLLNIAIERQKGFRWWTEGRRNWRRHERTYRAILADLKAQR